MRKKLVIIAMAALALLTAQCKKNEPKPSEKVMVPITGTVDFGGSKTEITTTGCINPVVGDKIYIYSNGGNVGYVNCTATSGQQFSCSGEIEEDCLGTTCTFMYLGTGSTDAGGDPIDGNSTTISFANQTSVSVSNGKIANLNQFQVGSCKALVSEQGTVTLPMLSKMAIAYFQLKDMQSNPIANKDITISGLSATATINKGDGALTGNSGDITVRTDASGSFYMALIPQNGSVEFTFSCVCYEDGTRTFSNGIRECNFYSEQGLGSPLQVNMASIPGALPGVFSVSNTKKVYFSKGNLWYGEVGAEATATLHFEDAQWKSIPTSDGNMDAGHVSHFTWSSTVEAAVGESNSGDYLFCDESHKVSVDESEEIYYALSKAEWQYLFNTPDRMVNSKPCYTNAINGVSIENETYKGVFVYPDNYDGDEVSNNSMTWEQIIAKGIVFLPAAGHRNKSVVSYTEIGYYWSSSTSGNPTYANCFFFSTALFKPGDYNERKKGFSVRLVTEAK